MNEVMVETVKIMGIGMGTVFFVLMLFYVMVRGLQIVFPPEE
ncbi:MAG TPA: OadG-related small transporter subunit [Clostridia bacterium]|nr:OadG-related small transporter subunit [Clostridia bacterium]